MTSDRASSLLNSGSQACDLICWVSSPTFLVKSPEQLFQAFCFFGRPVQQPPSVLRNSCHGLPSNKRWPALDPQTTSTVLLESKQTCFCCTQLCLLYGQLHESLPAPRHTNSRRTESISTSRVRGRCHSGAVPCQSKLRQACKNEKPIPTLNACHRELGESHERLMWHEERTFKSHVVIEVLPANVVVCSSEQYQQEHPEETEVSFARTVYTFPSQGHGNDTISICVCTYALIYMYTHVQIYICIYIYTYIYTVYTYISIYI